MAVTALVGTLTSCEVLHTAANRLSLFEEHPEDFSPKNTLNAAGQQTGAQTQNDYLKKYIHGE